MGKNKKIWTPPELEPKPDEALLRGMQELEVTSIIDCAEFDQKARMAEMAKQTFKPGDRFVRGGVVFEVMDDGTSMSVYRLSDDNG